MEPGDSSPRRAAVELLGDGDADSAIDISRESAAGEANDDAAGLRVLFAEESMGDAVECSSDMAAAGEYMCAEGGDLTMENAGTRAGEVGDFEEGLGAVRVGAAVEAENESKRCLADALPLLPPLPLSLSLEPDPESAGAAAASCCWPRDTSCIDNDAVGEASGERM